MFASISERSMFLSLIAFCGSKKTNIFDLKLLLIINKRDCISFCKEQKKTFSGVRLVDLSQGVIGGRVFRTGKLIFLLIKVLLGVVSKEISAQKETKKSCQTLLGNGLL